MSLLASRINRCLWKIGIRASMENISSGHYRYWLTEETFVFGGEKGFEFVDGGDASDVPFIRRVKQALALSLCLVVIASHSRDSFVVDLFNIVCNSGAE